MESKLPGPKGPDLDGDGIPGDNVWPPPSDWQIEVQVAPDFVNTEYRQSLKLAIDQINDILGRPWLVLGVPPSDRYAVEIEVGGRRPMNRTVFVHGDHGDDPNKGVTVLYYMETGEIISAEVTLPEKPNYPGDKAKIALHELGHVMGLAHDDGDEGSIMYPYYTAHSQKFTDADIALLKRAYR